MLLVVKTTRIVKTNQALDLFPEGVIRGAVLENLMASIGAD